MGHLKIINFPFGTNGKFIIFRCPKVWAHYCLIIMCLNIGTPNNNYFPFRVVHKFSLPAENVRHLWLPSILSGISCFLLRLLFTKNDFLPRLRAILLSAESQEEAELREQSSQEALKF